MKERKTNIRKTSNNKDTKSSKTTQHKRKMILLLTFTIYLSSERYTSIMTTHQ